MREGGGKMRRGRERLTGKVPPVNSSFCVSMKNSIQKAKVFSSGFAGSSAAKWRWSRTDLISWMFPAVDFRYLDGHTHTHTHTHTRVIV